MLIGNPIAIPKYPRDSTIQKIEERRNIEKSRKEIFTGISLDTTQAVVEKNQRDIGDQFFKKIGILSELLILNFEEHTVDIVEYGQVNISEILSSCTAYSFFYNQLHGDSETRILSMPKRTGLRLVEALDTPEYTT